MLTVRSAVPLLCSLNLLTMHGHRNLKLKNTIQSFRVTRHQRITAEMSFEQTTTFFQRNFTNYRTHGGWYVYWICYKMYLMLQIKSEFSMQKFCYEDKLSISWGINLLTEHQLVLHANDIKLNITQQSRQCTYNVTLRCLRVTIVAVEK